jgi:Neuraminidase (sialidase)
MDLDDRDAGVMETRRGTLLVTTFTSVAYESVFEKEKGKWPREKGERWEAIHRRLGPEERKRELGSWMIRSVDGGVHWTAPFRVPVNSPHGPVAVSDGRVLYAGKVLYGGEGEIGVCESADDGQTWRWLAKIPSRAGDRAADYHELHMVEASPGRLIAQIRNHNAANARETLQSESTDSGSTWTIPHPTGVWGLPSHLLLLRDSRLLMTYGYRRQPYGNHARLSTDGGKNWTDPIVISDDGTNSDLGYPSTVELRDGSLLTIWYETRPDSPKAVSPI